ncbi:MAG: sigma-70 family RNA polymerase sigma factor [Chloroflexota bacterium]|nr:sigma-70 family RNA polymerase sigma factor [Chloroflexota bacterium]
MELTTLIARVRAGDPAAFTALVQRHQELAFGYAFVILRDFHLAQDATQQAFIEVYRSLAGLEDPEKFPNWLRGIVRHQCGRILRKRRVPIVPLEAAAEIAARAPGPEQCAEDRDLLDAALRAVDELPPHEREVTVLYYLKERSQREIATFLALPVTTVNNRLHAARRRLRAALLPANAVGRALRRHGLADDFAEGVGRIVRTHGPLVDVRYPAGDLPPIFSALVVTGQREGDEDLLQVAQHSGDGIARCIAVPPSPGTPCRQLGQSVVKAGNTGGRAIGHGAVRAVAAVLGRPGPSEPPRLLETGIKAIDLLCPFPDGGRIGFFSDVGVGKLVLIQELTRTIGRERGSLTAFAFVRAADEVPFLWELAGREEDLFPSSAAVQVVYLPVDDPQALHADTAACFEAAPFLSRELALTGIFPAVDPLRSSSRLLRPDIVGEEHFAVARAVRRLLHRYRRLQARGARTPLTDEERMLAARARRVERFLSQPLFVAESWTKRAGQFVPREATVRSFRALLDGAYDAAPEHAFLYRGTLDQVPARIQAITPHVAPAGLVAE